MTRESGSGDMVERSQREKNNCYNGNNFYQKKDRMYPRKWSHSGYKKSWYNYGKTCFKCGLLGHIAAACAY